MSWRTEVIALIENKSKYGKYVRVNCPACLDRTGKPDYDKSISCNLSTGWLKCWRCNWRNRLDGHEDDEDTDGWEDVEETQAPIEQPSTYSPLVDPKTGTWRSHSLLKRGVAYVQKRDISIQIAQEAELGYAWDGQHKGRVVMPILGPFGWVGWTARLVGAGQAIKYRTSANFNRNKNLYGPVKLQDYVIVTEGPVDCLRVWPYGLATLGKPTLEQLDHLISRVAGRPVIMALDGDAWREGMGLVKLLQQHKVRATALILPAKSDLGGAPREAILTAAALSCEKSSTVDLR